MCLSIPFIVLCLTETMAHAGNLFVVGDPDQSIYRWRSAQADGYKRLLKDYPDATAIALEQNYRSTTRVLEVSKALIRQQQDRKDKDLWTSNGTGPAAMILSCQSAQDEAQKVVQAIVTGVHACQPHLPLNEVAILLRTNQMTRPFEEALNLAKLPYRLVGGKKVIYLLCPLDAAVLSPYAIPLLVL
eukprot:m.220346 g.220346  ORF g.220346 m.220346 type:complete len:187 (+) comp17243_c0_seq24:708-1268(+)